MLHRLRLDAALDELPHGLPKQLVLVGEMVGTRDCDHPQGYLKYETAVQNTVLRTTYLTFGL